MRSLQVTTHVPELASEGLQIKAIGGADWLYPVQDVISDIEHNVYSYWIYAAGRRTELVIAQRPNGSKFITTHADGSELKSLLALAEHLDPASIKPAAKPVSPRPYTSKTAAKSSRQPRGRGARAAG